MGFTKRKGVAAVAAVIIAVVFNIVVFLLPVLHSVTFWLGYSFAMLSTLLMLAVILFLFDSEDNSKTFARLPLAKIAWIYFILQMAASVWQISNFFAPYFPSLCVNCVLTGLFLIILLASHVAIESIESQEERTAQKVLFLKSIQVTLSAIKTSNRELAGKIERLAEDFKFSDPMSHSMLSEMEKQIETKVIMLKSEISDEEKAMITIECISDLLKERNQKCKMLKNVREKKPPKDNSGFKYIAIAISIVGALLAVALVICFIIVPSNKYKAAMLLYENGQFSEAILAFEEMDGFSKSNEMIEASKTAIKDELYQAAQALFENAEYAEAISAFEELDDYKDSKQMIETVQTAIKDEAYRQAQALFENGEYEEAISAFEKLGGFKDSKEMIESAKQEITANNYDLAEKNFAEQNYVEAIKQYNELGDYRDSKQKIEQIYNRLAEDDVIYYGFYRSEPIAWQMVREENNQLLLIAKEAVSELPYHDEIKNVAWSESSLYQWLNGDFLSAFSDNQLAAIIDTDIDGMNSKVFLLSQEEVEDIEAKSILQSETDWWLRTKAENNAMFVDPSGNVNEEGETIVRAKGVRPCIWIDLG